MASKIAGAMRGPRLLSGNSDLDITVSVKCEKKSISGIVGTTPAQAGGFQVLLKAGLIGHTTDSCRYTTWKSSSGSAGSGCLALFRNLARHVF
jgi:hypothetical protein